MENGRDRVIVHDEIPGFGPDDEHQQELQGLAPMKSVYKCWN